jgi:hypothetical protein
LAPEKIEHIRSQVQALKDSEILENFRLIGVELGQEEASGDSQMDMIEAPAKVFRHAETGVAISSQGTELKVSQNGAPLFEVFTLPKGGEFAVSFVKENFEVASAQALLESLNTELKLARELKSKRSAAFKDFKKS